jgi:hypothetical protein
VTLNDRFELQTPPDSRRFAIFSAAMNKCGFLVACRANCLIKCLDHASSVTISKETVSETMFPFQQTALRAGIFCLQFDSHRVIASRSSMSLHFGDLLRFNRFAFLHQLRSSPDLHSSSVQIFRKSHSRRTPNCQFLGNLPFGPVRHWDRFVFLHQSKRFPRPDSVIAMVLQWFCERHPNIVVRLVSYSVFCVDI